MWIDVDVTVYLRYIGVATTYFDVVVDISFCPMEVLRIPLQGEIDRERPISSREVEEDKLT